MAFRWRTRYTLGLTIALLLFIFVVAALASRIFYMVQPGQAAVLQRFFTGTDTEHIYGEGILVVFPWNTPFMYEVREQQVTQVVDVLSFNGLSIEVEFSFRFYPVFDSLGVLHQRLGPDYVEKVVKPLLVAGVREVIGHYRPEELYTTHSATIQDEIRQVCERDIEQNHIAFSQILVKDINLPDKVSSAIEDKLVLQQEAEGFDFRLMSEERERLRKKIEAEGIRDFNEIVASAPDDVLLRHKNIAALQALATSDNAKVVVLGGGRGNDGISLPIFMDDLGGRRSPGRSDSDRTSTTRPNAARTQGGEDGAPGSSGDPSQVGGDNTGTSPANVGAFPSNVGAGPGVGKANKTGATGPDTGASSSPGRAGVGRQNGDGNGSPEQGADGNSPRQSAGNRKTGNDGNANASASRPPGRNSANGPGNAASKNDGNATNRPGNSPQGNNTGNAAPQSTGNRAGNQNNSANTTGTGNNSGNNRANRPASGAGGGPRNAAGTGTGRTERVESGVDVDRQELP